MNNQENISERVLSERVERELNEYKSKYEMHSTTEFKVKTLLKLQEEYDSIIPASNTTKTRESILSMISNLGKNIQLTPKQVEPQFDYTILIVVDDNNSFIKLYKLFTLIIPEKELNKLVNSPGRCELQLNNGINIYITDPESFFRVYPGIKFIDNYLNFTDDIKFENEVLKPLLKKINNV